VGSRKSATADNRDVIARELILAEELADFHLNEVEKLGIVNEVNLVQEDDDGRNADLTSEKDVLAGLWHRTVSCRNNDDCAVHLSSTGNHVLNEVSVAGAVNVSVVTVLGAVFNV
jgi:hypothetical protein